MSDLDSNISPGRDEADRVAAVMLDDIENAVQEGDRRWLSRVLARLHPADASDTLEQLSPEDFSNVVALLGEELPSDVLIELRDEYREDAVEALPDEAVTAAIGDLDSDDATAILEDMEDDRRDRILDDLTPEDRAPLEQALDFDEETAGRLMQREFVAAPEFWTVGHTVDHARDLGDDLPDQFFEIYVVDPAFKVLGGVPLATLLRTSRDVPLSDIMRDNEATIETGMDQEEVAYLFQKYHLASAPVVDENGRITGMITVDDMVDVIQEENTEDLLALSGVSSADGSDTVWESVRARAPWLAINLVTAFVASGIISLFEPALNTLVALAILMPVVAALGGNAGSQALAVTVRAIAEREMEGSAAQRAVRREVLTGLVNGVLFAIGVGVVTLVWFQNVSLALTIGAAILATFIWGCLAGILVPLTMKRLGADPAVASSVFVLTLTDIIAFFSFLGLATLVFL
ncbi:MAG: magnesium transporter [Pseudomonadota bacterium]